MKNFGVRALNFISLCVWGGVCVWCVGVCVCTDCYLIFMPTIFWFRSENCESVLSQRLYLNVCFIPPQRVSTNVKRIVWLYKGIKEQLLEVTSIRILQNNCVYF